MNSYEDEKHFIVEHKNENICFYIFSWNSLLFMQVSLKANTVIDVHQNTDKKLTTAMFSLFNFSDIKF